MLERFKNGMTRDQYQFQQKQPKLPGGVKFWEHGSWDFRFRDFEGGKRGGRARVPGVCALSEWKFMAPGPKSYGAGA
jgi:hypothetical protein